MDKLLKNKNIMKKLIVLFAVLLLTVSSSFATKNPELVREIQSKVIVDLSRVDLDEYNPDYILVEFKIIDDEINILEINGTSKELKEMIIKELCEIEVDSNYNSNFTYRFKFTFELR